MSRNLGKKPMFPSTTNGFVHHSAAAAADSSSSSSKPHDDETHLSYEDDYASASANHYNFISSFNNLTLLPNPPEIGSSSQNRIGTMCLPQALDDAYPGGTNSFGPQTGMPQYYSPVSPSYIQEQAFVGMGQIYPTPAAADMLTTHHAAPHINSYAACNVQSPNIAAGYHHYPNNVPFPALVNPPYPQFPLAPMPPQVQITADMLSDILLNPYDYMTDPTLNRPLSRFLERFSNSQFVTEFVKAVTRSNISLVAAACTYYGTCVLQTLIKVTKKRPVIALLPRAIADATPFLMTHQFGMHVVKQCFIELDRDKYEPLFDKLMEDNSWVDIAKNVYGCRGLNECIDNMVHEFKTRLHARVALFAGHLALDIYGTYIVQHAIDLRTIHTEHIVENIVPFIDVLITIKNGSHLLEKCLATPYSSLIIDALLRSNKVVKYALHEFANYVIQAAIRCAQVTDRVKYEKLMKILTREKNSLQVNKHGKYVAKLLPNQLRCD